MQGLHAKPAVIRKLTQYTAGAEPGAVCAHRHVASLKLCMQKSRRPRHPRSRTSILCGIYLCRVMPSTPGCAAAWVRSQSRMTATSNQETWRADIAGVLVFDVLRQVHLTSFCPWTMLLSLEWRLSSWAVRSHYPLQRPQKIA